MTPAEIRYRINSVMSSHAGMPPMDKTTMDQLYYEAALKASELVDCPQLKAESIQNIVSGTSEYLLPTTLHEFVDVQLLNSVTGYYEPLDCVEFSLLRNYQEYTVYAHSGIERTAGADYGKRKIKLAPAPVENLTNGLQVTYKLKPTRLSALTDTAEVLDFPESIQAAIPMMVAFLWFGWQGSKANKEVAGYNSYFEAECRRVAARLSDQQQQDVRRQITTDWGGIVL